MLDVTAGWQGAGVRRVARWPKRAPSAQPFYRATFVTRDCSEETSVVPGRTITRRFLSQIHSQVLIRLPSTPVAQRLLAVFRKASIGNLPPPGFGASKRIGPSPTQAEPYLKV